MPDRYTISLAEREHIHLLADIELAAAASFPERVIAPALRTNVVAVAQLQLAQAEARLWVALSESKTVVGFAVVVPEADCALLQEIDVHPDHQRQGIGRRLIQKVIVWAKAKQLSAVTLTTFEYVPWNAPFYQGLGFNKLSHHELALAPSLNERLQRELTTGLKERVAMRLLL